MSWMAKSFRYFPEDQQKDEGIIPYVFVERNPQDIGNNFDREIAMVKSQSKSNCSRDFFSTVLLNETNTREQNGNFEVLFSYIVLSEL